LSATQKSWRGLGSEATAFHEITARIAMKRRMHEEEKEAILLLAKSMLETRRSWLCVYSIYVVLADSLCSQHAGIYIGI
jgi:hypothetical protein